MAVDVQRPAAGQVKRREGMLVVVVAAADDGALIAFRHYERQRGGCHLPMVQRSPILRGHVDEHAPEPVVGNRGQQIGPQPKLGAAECCRHRVAAERDGIIPSNCLLVTGWQRIREKGDIDISLADEKSFHNLRCLVVDAYHQAWEDYRSARTEAATSLTKLTPRVLRPKPRCGIASWIIKAATSCDTRESARSDRLACAAGLGHRCRGSSSVARVAA